MITDVPSENNGLVNEFFFVDIDSFDKEEEYYNSFEFDKSEDFDKELKFWMEFQIENYVKPVEAKKKQKRIHKKKEYFIKNDYIYNNYF
jgi:hypothetical protein